MPESDLPLLIDAARESGRIAMRYWRKQPQAWEKPDGAGPVTVADLAVDRMLEKELRASRPDYGWLSEESVDDPLRRQAHDRVFIIDPIDGTRAFIAGEEGFAHSLAVADQGTITAAVVYLPARDALYSATASGLATLNGAPITAAAPARAEGARVLTAHQSLDPTHWKGGIAPGFRRSFRSSLAWRLCLVAEGRYDAALSFREIWEWDLAAGDLIARRAGVTVSDRLGQGVRFNTTGARARGLVAAEPSLHGEVMGRLLPWPAA